MASRTRVSAGRRPPLVLVVLAGLAAGVALLPLGYLGVRAFGNGPDFVFDVLWRERTARLVGRSLLLAAVVTLACLVIGISTAWLVVRSDLRWRRLWGVLAALPLAVPSYVAAMTWLSRFPQMQGFTGAAAVLTLCSYPYVFLPVAASLQRSDPALEEIAMGLGRRPLSTFFAVTLRQCRPAAAAGSLLVALYVLSDFGAVSILRYDTFTRVIYTSYRASFDRTPAAILACLLVILTVVIVFAEARTRGRAGHARVGGGVARARRAARLSVWQPVALGWVALISALAVAFPLVNLGLWMVRGASAGLEFSALSTAAASTIWVSLLGALVTTLLALPVGILAARHRNRLSTVLEQTTYSGHALPGIVVALSLVFFAVHLAYPIYQRTPLLVIAYAVLFLPAAVGAVRASVSQAPAQLEEVARSLGRSPLRVVRDVTVPLAGPGIAAGALLVFLTCMKELPATLLLRPTGMETLATELWSHTAVGQFGAAAPYAVVLVGLAAVPTFLLGRRQAAVAGE